MDSSNSGSYQSSNGGAADTEEYNSRTQPISSFLNNNMNTSNNTFNNNLIQPTNTTFFNPTSLNPVQDLTSLWTGPSQPSHPAQLDRFSTYPMNTNPLPLDTTTKPGLALGHALGSSNGSGQHDHHNIGVIKNPKKRTRASRRAPTTVLTTDTTNFRQMVQEFTGIPTGPFTGSAAFSRRLDIFRPAATKFQPQPPFLNTIGNDNIHPSTIDDFQKQPSSLVDMQNNPMLSFQSLLQSTLNHHQENSNNELSGFASSSKMGSFEGVIGNNDQSIGVSKVNSGDQVQGNNDGSWICHSN